MSAEGYVLLLQHRAEYVFKLVAEGSTAEQWAEWLRVPLEHAARKGDDHLVRILLGSGANGSTGWLGDCNGDTLLSAGAVGGSEHVITTLLEAGGKADLNVPLPAHGNGSLPAHGNGSALHVAVAQGAVGAARALMAAGAYVDAVDDRKRCPLHLAAESGHCLMIRDLLLRGARPDERDLAGDAPLHLAAEGAHASSVWLLLADGADKDSLDGSGRTPLFRAVEDNDLNVAGALLFVGADVNHRPPNEQCSALQLATTNRQLLMVGLLISKTQQVAQAGKAGYTQLLFLIAATNLRHDNASVISYLVEVGADVNFAQPGGLTPLHLCAYIGHRLLLGNVRALLQGGADVNAGNSDGMTALHFACLSSDAHVVDLLLRWGADETVTSNDGRTAIDILISREVGDEAGNDRTRRVLARAPADRSWRRRSWLVLCRSCPDRVSLTSGSDPTANSGKGGNVGTIATRKRRARRRRARAASRGERSGAWGEGPGGDPMRGPRSVVARVVGLQEDGIFREVVGYL